MWGDVLVVVVHAAQPCWHAHSVEAFQDTLFHTTNSPSVLHHHPLLLRVCSQFIPIVTSCYCPPALLLVFSAIVLADTLKCFLEISPNCPFLLTIIVAGRPSFAQLIPLLTPVISGPLRIAAPSCSTDSIVNGKRRRTPTSCSCSKSTHDIFTSNPQRVQPAVALFGAAGLLRSTVGTPLIDNALILRAQAQEAEAKRKISKHSSGAAPFRPPTYFPHISLARPLEKGRLSSRRKKPPTLANLLIQRDRVTSLSTVTTSIDYVGDQEEGEDDSCNN
uniref:Uncharacterized protein n=1 Tax=Ditylenchus dipsaci TaxID=166011 RepID=A0A915E1R8_9BILA